MLFGEHFVDFFDAFVCRYAAEYHDEHVGEYVGKGIFCNEGVVFHRCSNVHYQVDSQVDVYIGLYIAFVYAAPQQFYKTVASTFFFLVEYGVRGAEVVACQVLEEQWICFAVIFQHVEQDTNNDLDEVVAFRDDLDVVCIFVFITENQTLRQ